MRKPRALSAMMLLAIVGTSSTFAQTFPSRPLRILTSEPGGGNDVMARLLSSGLSANLGQPVVVENRPSGPIPRGIVIKSVPDGHTVLFTTGGFWLIPVPGENIDVFRDFAPVTLANTQPSILVVHPGSAFNTVAELIAAAKARPGELNYSSGASGSSSHLAAELFKYLAGINIVRIPYKGAGPAVSGIVANQVHMMIATASSVTPHITAKRLRALGVSSARPSELLPGMPAIAASGLPGFETSAMFGVFAPGRTPPALVRRLQQEFARVLHQPEIKEKFAGMGVEVVGNTPDAFVAIIKADIARMGKVIKAAGIAAE